MPKFYRLVTARRDQPQHHTDAQFVEVIINLESVSLIQPAAIREGGTLTSFAPSWSSVELINGDQFFVPATTRDLLQAFELTLAGNTPPAIYPPAAMQSLATDTSQLEHPAGPVEMPSINWEA